MKSQNKNNKLAFNKAAVTELNSNEMNNVNGGAAQSLISTIIIPIIVWTIVR